MWTGYLEFILSVAAICIAGLFAIICIIFIIVVIVKLRGISTCIRRLQLSEYVNPRLGGGGLAVL